MRDAYAKIRQWACACCRDLPMKLLRRRTRHMMKQQMRVECDDPLMAEVVRRTWEIGKSHVGRRDQDGNETVEEAKEGEAT
jgi:hypothetical protein